MIYTIFIHAPHQLFYVVGVEEPQHLHQAELAQTAIEIATEAVAVIESNKADHLVVQRLAFSGQLIEKWLNGFEKLVRTILGTALQLSVSILQMGMEVYCVDAAFHYFRVDTMQMPPP